MDSCDWEVNCATCLWTKGPACHCGCKKDLAEKDATIARLEANRDDWKDLLDFYFNHYMNCGGQRRWIVDGPLGMQWRLTQKIDGEWEQIDGPGERKDYPTAEAAIRKARDIATAGYFACWTPLNEDDDDAALTSDTKGE